MLAPVYVLAQAPRGVVHKLAGQRQVFPAQ
jgi:hypothetical protein